MLRSKFNFFNILFGFLLFSVIKYEHPSRVFADEFPKVELNKELKRGNFLIGLSQYLGGENDNFSMDNKITFSTEKGYLYLYSSNGIKNKSKNIQIFWKEIPVKDPYVRKRFVFGPYASYETAKKQAQNLIDQGFKAFVAYPKNWEVWIPFESNLTSFDDKYKISKKVIKSQIIPFLRNDYKFLKLQGPISISAKEDIKINGINYGKDFFIVQDLYGTWTLIQKIKFDDYLKGVLPYEIGANSPLEALKAQAVIARTWGIYNSERFNMDKYHLCITTQCQVYKPVKVQSEKILKAIKETSNLILTYKNKPINSFYHGSNGGITATSSESWKIKDYAYFQTKFDGSKVLINSFKLPMSDSELKKFLEFEVNLFYGMNHNLFRWDKRISKLMIENNLIKNNLLEKYQKVVDINVKSRGLSGRVTKLEIKLMNSDEPIFLVKDDIRRVFSFLPSNLFIINKLNDNFWFFRGGGFGHGVGLSQSGAIDMAKLGFSYEQILNHYYEGTKVKKIEILSQ